MQDNKAKLNRTSLGLLRCKPKSEIFELGLILVQIEIWNFRFWPYWGANWNSTFSSLALLWCKSEFDIFERGLIVVQIGIRHFRAWPYNGTNRLGLIDVLQCKISWIFDDFFCFSCVFHRIWRCLILATGWRSLPLNGRNPPTSANQRGSAPSAQ